jgi:hypothetical protein
VARWCGCRGGIDTTAEPAAEGAVDSPVPVKETVDEDEMQRETAKLEATTPQTPSADGPRSLADVFDMIFAEMCENVSDASITPQSGRIMNS